MKRNNQKRGFTIVELVIVIAVIAILAAVMIPTFANLVKKANESSDIQAARNMNTFLAAANALGEVNSILDVYDAFEDSGYAVENYKPLYKDRSYYYDKEYNQILYVDENLKVIYPTEHKGDDVTNRPLMALDMSAPASTQPTGDNYKYDTTTKTMTATVKNAAEYAFVIDEYNQAAVGTTLNLTINGTIDMKGAKTIIEEAKGDIKITGSNNAVIKNITSNYSTTSTDNAAQTPSQYNATALIGKTTYNVTIENITFENLNVKNIYSTASFLVGTSTGGGFLTVDNVTIKDSTLVGHRWVGAVGSQICCKTATITNLTLTNTSVKTVGGRSAMILGADRNCTIHITNFKNENSTFGIYESKKSEQTFSDTAPAELKKYDQFENGVEGKYITSIKNDNTQERSTYGYKDGALVFVHGSGTSPETNAIVLTDPDHLTFPPQN